MRLHELPPVPADRHLRMLRASGSTPVSTLAGSVVENCRSGFDVRVRAVGAGALNQAVKACAIARTMLAQGQNGTPRWDLTLIPVFETVQIDGADRSAMTLIVVTVRSEEEGDDVG